MNNRPRFTAAEERELYDRMRAGDAEAKDLLARSVLDLACRVTLSRAGGGVDKEELVSLAYCAVGESLMKYWDPDKGRLSTITWRRANTLAGVAAWDWSIIHVPRDTPHVDVEKAAAAQRIRRLGVGRGPRHDVRDRREIAFYDDEAERQQASIDAAMGEIDQRAADIIRGRLMHGEQYKVIAKRHGISRTRCQQIFEQWIPQLRARARELYGASTSPNKPSTEATNGEGIRQHEQRHHVPQRPKGEREPPRVYGLDQCGRR